MLDGWYVRLMRDHLSAGHLFAPARFYDEVPYDPFLLFGGQEDLLALRAWTWRWDIFNPSLHMRWQNCDRGGAARLWNDHLRAGGCDGRARRERIERAARSGSEAPRPKVETRSRRPSQCLP